MVSKKQAEEAVGRWTAKRKVEVILAVIKGEAVLVDVCRKHDCQYPIGETTHN